MGQFNKYSVGVVGRQRAEKKYLLARLMQLFDEFAHGWAGFG